MGMTDTNMVLLGDVATYINGYPFSPSDYSEMGRPIIRIQNLTGNDHQTNHFAGEISPKYLVQRGDILVSWSASLGVYVWKGENAWLNQHIFKVVFDKMPIEHSFFFHQMSYLLLKSSSLAHGATMKHLTKRMFDALPFRLPSPDAQKHQSSVLNLIDTLIDQACYQAGRIDMLVKSRFAAEVAA